MQNVVGVTRCDNQSGTAPMLRMRYAHGTHETVKNQCRMFASTDEGLSWLRQRWPDVVIWYEKRVKELRFPPVRQQLGKAMAQLEQEAASKDLKSARQGQARVKRRITNSGAELEGEHACACFFPKWAEWRLAAVQTIHNSSALFKKSGHRRTLMAEACKVREIECVAVFSHPCKLVMSSQSHKTLVME